MAIRIKKNWTEEIIVPWPYFIFPRVNFGKQRLCWCKSVKYIVMVSHAAPPFCPLWLLIPTKTVSPFLCWEPVCLKGELWAYGPWLQLISPTPVHSTDVLSHLNQQMARFQLHPCSTIFLLNFRCKFWNEKLPQSMVVNKTRRSWSRIPWVFLLLESKSKSMYTSSQGRCF